MRDLLPLLPRPSQYLGTEPNAVHKDPTQVRVRAALAFPDLYEVGMSYLGGRILYHAVNAHPEFWAERAFAPPLEAAQILRDSKTPLSTLESATPLGDMDVLAFSLTHELCYTNVLYMLDLAGIPFRSEDRDESHPLILGGGGVVFNAEPMAPFFDLLVAGDGEEALPEILALVDRCKTQGMSRAEFLQAARNITGCYVPSFFAAGPEDVASPSSVPQPLYADYAQVEKRILPDLSAADFPTNQIVPFGPVVHDRLSIEIARGCTRGCRFCQAGMIYRPVRERRLDELDRIIQQALDRTGFDELSFLSLSTGDFSCLDALFQRSHARCRDRQVSVSLPSLRVGSVSGQVMDMIAGIRRTGITLAPEAGSQRLRDVINKNITEEALLDHTRELFTRGWSAVKLYFMIGLPTETDEDLQAIVDLCLKVAATAGERAKRLQITASISPFVPKPQTPFQWEEQISFEETRRRLNRLRDLFRPRKRLVMRWHMPEMSYLEGVFSRGDRALADVVERAFAKGALFSSWADSLSLESWLGAMRECGLDPDWYLRARDPEQPLPWDHISSGIRRSFLLRERRLALEGRTTSDCRHGKCLGCGVCTTTKVKTALRRQTGLDIRPRVNQDEQVGGLPPGLGDGTDGSDGLNGKNGTGGEQPEEDLDRTPGQGPEDLGAKANALRIVYRKLGPAVYFSQLELTRLFERCMRRAGVAMSFSQGFHPMPRMSFGRALPVGVGSVREEMVIVLRAPMSAADLRARLAPEMPRGLEIRGVENAPLNGRADQPVFEEYLLHLLDRDAPSVTEAVTRWRSFLSMDQFPFARKTKRGSREINLRALFRSIRFLDVNRLRLLFDFREDYLNPWTTITAVTPELSFRSTRLIKIRGLSGDAAKRAVSG
ncbi:TIGR03960 family B12-binding radical SAM protein [Desulfonatronum sp. SC1]|uniref:TIGR03960 family B12-binding radical SAM protein n=1 Tax=Desulfonatronum sp. SC1 TaxID=2109626 RepID=UPI000D302692|nr:TIGR03960 family B12-binding radical SAM protein [Desulfonatronum sp. SC1]PTN31325.1 TIGR03960 family radical SAM protein [Desulfonatronum sp. SC1]